MIGFVMFITEHLTSLELAINMQTEIKQVKEPQE